MVDTKLDDITAAGTLDGTERVYVVKDVTGTPHDRRTTTADIAALASATPGGTAGQVQYNATGSFGGFTVGGDGTLNTSTGALTITKTNGVSFSSLATTTPGAGVATFLATPSSANLAAALTDETGTGAAVFANTPTLVTPVLGVASATSINKVTLTTPATGSTLTVADGKTLTASNTLTFTGTDSSSVAFGAGGTVAYTANKLSAFAATTSAELAGVISDETGTGALVFASAIRTKLAADTAYYVRTDGNNANTGTANTAGGAWLTIQHAVDWVFANLDFAGFVVTINIADGTYNEDVTINGVAVGQRGVASLVLHGNTTTPANVVVNAGAYAFTSNGAQFTVEGMKFTGGGLGAFGGGRITGTANSLEFGDCTGNIHMDSEDLSVINVSSPYTISGPAWAHAYCYGASLAIGGASTVTVSGTPAFSHAFAHSDSIGNIYAAGLTFSGSATGKRYQVDANSVINTGGGGANYFPGNSAGTSGTGGQYI